MITSLILFIAGLLGVAAHAFKKTDERNKAQEPKYSIIDYWNDNKNGIITIIICLIVCAYYQNEIKQLEQLGTWLGLFFFALGYMGDSAFPSILEAFPKVIEKVKTGLGLGSNKNEQ